MTLKKIPTNPPTFDNIIPLKLLKFDKIHPYQTKAPDYIANRCTILHRQKNSDFFSELM